MKKRCFWARSKENPRPWSARCWWNWLGASSGPGNFPERPRTVLPGGRHHTRFTRLFSDHVLVVASPALLARVGTLAGASELLKWPLLWVDWGNEYLALPSWRDWFAAVGVDAGQLHRDLVFSLPSAAVDAAVESQGFALVQYSMAASALALGTLVRVLPPEMPLAESHFLAWSGAALDKPVGAAFHAWIIREARRFDWQRPSAA